MANYDNEIELIILNGATRQTFTTIPLPSPYDKNVSIVVCQSLKVEFLLGGFVRVEMVQEEKTGPVRIVIYDNGDCHIKYRPQQIELNERVNDAQINDCSQ